jgi:PAS domain-containing protein
MGERRRQQSPTDAQGYLRQLPALALLDRLPTAMLGVGHLGDIAYANPACAEMLGYPDGGTVTRLQLPALLTGHEALAPADCLTTLRTAAAVVEWNHNQNYVVRTMVSAPLLLRETDTLLLIGVTDVTAWLWETSRVADAPRTEGHGPSRPTDRE